MKFCKNGHRLMVVAHPIDKSAPGRNWHKHMVEALAIVFAVKSKCF